MPMEAFSQEIENISCVGSRRVHMQAFITFSLVLYKKLTLTSNSVIVLGQT